MITTNADFSELSSPGVLPGDASAGKFLKADGTWSAPPTLAALRYDTAQSLSSGEKQQARANAGAPTLPQTASGIGQWTGVNSSTGGAAVLPAGGTWAWFRLPKAVSTGAWAGSITVGVDAGGTTIASGTSDVQWNCLAWRVA